MKRLFDQRYLVRKNLLPMIGFSLCFYFCYHLIQGERSLIRFISLQKSVQSLQLESKEIAAEHDELETKVSMMRPGSINKDLLEERARIVLGFRRQGEVDILSKN